MGLKRRYFSVLSQRSVGVQLLVFLIASYTNINAVTLGIEDSVFKFWLITNRMEAEANFQMRGSVSTIGMQMHRIGHYIAARRQKSAGFVIKNVGVATYFVYWPC